MNDDMITIGAAHYDDAIPGRRVLFDGFPVTKISNRLYYELGQHATEDCREAAAALLRFILTDMRDIDADAQDEIAQGTRYESTWTHSLHGRVLLVANPTSGAVHKGWTARFAREYQPVVPALRDVDVVALRQAIAAAAARGKTPTEIREYTHRLVDGMCDRLTTRSTS